MFEDAHPLEILRWAGEAFAERLVVTASFEDAVLVHLVSQAAPGADVVLLDTGYLFAETVWFAEQLRDRLDLKIRIIEPQPGTPTNVWQHDTNACCEAEVRLRHSSSPTSGKHMQTRADCILACRCHVEEQLRTMRANLR